jgi:hypothetical protein
MKCDKCGYEGPKTSFKYLYRARLESSQAMRECPKCLAYVVSDELDEGKPAKAK